MNGTAAVPSKTGFALGQPSASRELMLAALAYLNTPQDLPRGSSGQAHGLLDAALRRLRAAVDAVPLPGRAPALPKLPPITGPLLDLRLAAETAVRAQRPVASARAARVALTACLARYTAHLRMVAERRAA